MNFSKQIISIWIVANILFIPGFKSLDLVQNNTHYICTIDIDQNSNNDSEDLNKYQLKALCDKCDFFHDHDSSFIVTTAYSLTYKDIANFNTVKNYLYNHTNKLQQFTRAPPNIA